MSLSTYKILCIGECMIEMVQTDEGLYKALYAGDTFNTSQYLAWLGEEDNIDVSYMTVLGRDRFGSSMLENWSRNGVDTSLVMTTDQKNTGLYFADLDDQGNRDYTFFRSDSAARLLFKMKNSNAFFEKALDYSIIYISAITLMILDDKDRQKLVDFYKKAFEKGIITVFDTNYRPSGWISKDEARLWINAIMPYTTIALPTFDENKELFGDKTPHETLNRFLENQISEIVVKCGGEGCKIRHNNEEYDIGAEKNISVFDTTAAGDSFNAGYLYARLKGCPPDLSASFAHKVAAKVIGHRGAIIDKTHITELINNL